MKKNMENMNKNNEHSITDNIYKKINSGAVSMRPKWHFVLKATLAILGVVIFLLASLFLVSFLLFAFRNSGIGFMPYLGFRGIIPLILSLPWILIIVSLLFVVVLEVLVRRYSFAYRKPLSYSLLAIIILVFSGGAIVAESNMHDRFLERAEGVKAPGPIGNFYKNNLDKDIDGIYVGVVKNFEDEGFLVTLIDGEEVQIATTSMTRIPPRLIIREGDEVIVLTEGDDDLMMATDIRKLPKNKTNKIKTRRNKIPNNMMKLSPPPFGGPVFDR